MIGVAEVSEAGIPRDGLLLSDYPELKGELGPRAFRRWPTLILGLSGMLLVLGTARLLGRLVLRRRQPARLRLTERGLELDAHTSLLGQTTVSRHVIIPLREITRVERRVRYQGLGFYAGLTALLLGAFLGSRWFAEGLLALTGAPSLFGMGLLAAGLGVTLDFLFTTGMVSSRGKCSLDISLRHSPPISVTDLDVPLANAILRRLDDALAAPEAEPELV